MKISLITTERNEVESIAEFIESALTQSMKPDEIIIADGGSTDGTLEIIQSYIDKGVPIKLVVKPGNRSIGRNAATEAASHEVIAVTDVGCRMDEDWLKHITQPFRDNPKAMVVSGFFLPESKTFFEEVSATLMLAPNDKIDLDTWLPSSRSIAYTKTAWKKAGGYPEHTNFNEDTPYDLALREQGFKFEDGLKAIVYWRPRPDLREFYRQYYFYALGDALDNISSDYFQRLSMKYTILILATIVLGVFLPLFAWLPLAFLVYKTVVRIYPAYKKMPSIKAFGLMALLITTYDISQIAGYWNGTINKSRLRGSKKLVR